MPEEIHRNIKSRLLKTEQRLTTLEAQIAEFMEEEIGWISALKKELEGVRDGHPSRR
ncbi:MAG: hypothetical protein OWU33_13600 [Firmicutes bacterium]|nr:hypothetical protein [Bacillota bacterium]